jgi:acyl carrier protein phosphodiesterase
MNYLGHAFLSFGDSGVLLGNMIGDHVKGKLALEKYPVAIRKGIELHRKIDSTIDVHPGTQRAKLIFREDYGLYSGAIMDTLFDHFLANDPRFFINESALLAFTEKTYNQLEENTSWFPEKFAAYYPHMRQQNWLYNYRHLKGMERSLRGLHRRASNMPGIEKAYEIFVSNYYLLNQCYYEAIDDMVNFVKIELCV